MFNSNTPIESMWGLVCTMQLMSYLTLMQVDVPPNLNKFIGYMENVHSFGSMIPNAFKYLIKEKQLIQSNKYFKERGYITNIALYLCGSDLEMLIAQILIVPIISKLSNKLKYFYSQIQISQSILQKGKVQYGNTHNDSDVCQDYDVFDA